MRRWMRGLAAAAWLLLLSGSCAESIFGWELNLPEVFLTANVSGSGLLDLYDSAVWEPHPDGFAIQSQWSGQDSEQLLSQLAERRKGVFLDDGESPSGFCLYALEADPDAWAVSDAEEGALYVVLVREWMLAARDLEALRAACFALEGGTGSELPQVGFRWIGIDPKETDTAG